MKRALARKWAAALESGDYKQGTGELRNKKNSFCCLGVLCNIHAQEHPEIAANEGRKNEYLGFDAYLPEQVMEWAGVKSQDGTFQDGGYVKDSIDNPHYDLASLNDSESADFKDIAKVIRKHWKDL